MPNVNERSAAVERMARDWKMIDALVEGTSAMRDGGETYLLKGPDEDDDSYGYRLKTATLFPAYRRTLSVMAGKPFSTELQLSDDTPANIQEWAKDIDREGVSLHVFASEMFAESFSGLAFIFVDAPPQVNTGARKPTLADQKAAGLRPYWVRIKHSQILGWKIERVGGARKITQFRYMECVEVDDGAFGTKEVDQVRVLEPGLWRTFVKSEKDDTWIQNGIGTTELNVVPIVPVYGSRVGYLDGRPPLRDLAHLNVKHWQKQSDHDTIVHAASVPILFAKGFSSTESITISPWLAVKAENAESDLKWVEHNGGAIEAGANSIAALEDQMIQSGAELMVNKAGTKTATEDANDAEGNRCDLARQVEDFEDSLNQALALTALYAKQDAGGTVTLFKDFGVSSLSDASATLIQQLAAGGVISKETAIIELQRRGELSPDIDPADEAERVANEGPALGTLMAPGEPGPGPNSGKTVKPGAVA